MTDESEPFQRGVIRPMECIRAGWALIKERYWLFFGITVLGMLIATAGPFGVLMGPMMCGIYYCLFRQMRGEPVKFDMLFKGFEHFIQSLIAALIMMIPMVVVMVPGYIAMFVTMFAAMPKQQPGQQAQPPDPAALTAFFVVMGLFILLLLVVQLVVTVLFFFTFPLIIDRKMKGIDAMKMSYRAAKANFGGVLGLVLLDMLFSFIGALACYVGAFFVIPIHFAANAVAYRKVFPSLDEPEPRNDPWADLQALPPQG